MANLNASLLGGLAASQFIQGNGQSQTFGFTLSPASDTTMSWSGARVLFATEVIHPATLEIMDAVSAAACDFDASASTTISGQ